MNGQLKSSQSFDNQLIETAKQLNKTYKKAAQARMLTTDNFRKKVGKMVGWQVVKWNILIYLFDLETQSMIYLRYQRIVFNINPEVRVKSAYKCV